MRRSLRLLILFLLPLTLTAQRLERLFYVVDREDCFQSFQRNIGSIDIIAPQVFDVDRFGIVSGSVDKRILDLARKHNIRVMPLVMNSGFDQPTFHALLTDTVAQDRAIQGMLMECRTLKLYGIQFDFENIHVTDKDLFTAFYRRTARALHAAGYAISVAVVPRISDDPGPTSYHKWIYEYWRGVYDYKALADAGDFISLMTYDQHTYRTPPGPVAGLTWMDQVVRFVMKDVPAEKISLGLPFYSYYWYPYAKGEETHVWGRGLDYIEAKGIADRFSAQWRWDETEGVYYTWFNNESLNEFIFLEDARSFRAKMEYVKKHQFRGISVWRLGHEDPGVWKEMGK